MDYIAIDFETANSNLDSACALGIVGVENDKIVLSKYYLINPLEEFNPYNISIHHITLDMVKEAKTFKEVWEEIKDYFNTIVISHNAAFDLSVLYALLKKYDLEFPSFKIACTVKISQKLWKGILPNCKLNTISSYLEVSHNHHNAISDAYVCYEIIKRSKIITSSDTLDEVMESLSLLYGYLNKDKFYLPKNKYKDYNTKAKENFFKGKIVCYGGKPHNFTKKKVSEILQINGAIISRFIDRSLDVFIVFDNFPIEKKKRLDEIQTKTKILIINEEEFIKLLGEQNDC